MATSTTDTAGTPQPGDAKYRAHQRADLLGYVAAARIPVGFGWVDTTGGVDEAGTAQLWITCRMTHTAALGYLANEPPAPNGPTRAQLFELVEHGVAALTGPLRDVEYGGWFAEVGPDGPVNTAKEAYGHAFVVLAASSATAAGVPGARELLNEALALASEKFWDEEAGLSVDVWDRTWSTLDPYRGINANMHTVEAYLAAGDVTRERKWHERAARIAGRVIAWAGAQDWRIPEHFDTSWTPLPEYNADNKADRFRPYGATVGHGLEWARLIVSVARSLPEADMAQAAVPAAVALYAAAVADGWGTDGADGFVYTTDWEGNGVVTERLHWVVCEAINTCNAMVLATGEQRYRDDSQRWWDYADKYLIDHENGSWWHQLDPENRPAFTIWPGKPDQYHAYQACLAADVPLTPSYAAALAAGEASFQ